MILFNCPREKGKKMKEHHGEWSGSIKDLREWLNQFNDEDEIAFIGGSDSGWEFMDVLVNGEIVVEVG